MEEKFVVLRKKFEKGNTQIRFENSSIILDNIINSKKTSNIKTGLGYDPKNSNEASISKAKNGDKSPKTYAVSLKNSLKKEEKRRKENTNQ